MERATRALVKKELLQLLRSRQLLFFFAAEVALAVASFSLAARQWAREAESGRILAETNQRRLATLNSWSDVEDTGVLVSPPTPAGRFLVSTEPWPGFLVTIPELPTPLGGLDRQALPPPAQVLMIFYSLFALLLSFDAVGAEKAQRTLGLLLAVSGSRRLLLEVKLGVRAAVVAAATVTSLLLAALGTSALVPEFVTDPSFLRVFAGLVVFLTAYAVLFVAVALMVSCLFPEPLTSLLAGVGAWVAIVIALPGVGQAIAHALVPPPSRTLFDAQATALYARHHQRSDEAMVEPLRRWAREGPSAQQWFEGEANRIRRQLRGELQRELLALFDGFMRAEQRSATLALGLGAVFPTGLYQDALAALGGADRSSMASYVQAVTQYAQVVAQAVEKKVGSVRFIMTSEDDPYAHSRPRLEDLPRFGFAPPHAPWSSQVPRLVGVVLWAAVFYALALVLFGRLDPR